jgi:hypothetical protein
MRNFIFKKVAIIGILVIAILIVVFASVPGTAALDPEVGISLEDISKCRVYDGQGILQSDQDLIQITKIYGPNGLLEKILLECSGNVDSADQGAVKWTSDVNPEGINNLRCRVFDGGVISDITSDWKITVSSSGNVKLTCHFEDPK